MIEYEQELLKRGEDFRAQIAEKTDHLELTAIDADLAARRARVTLLTRQPAEQRNPEEDMLAFFGCSVDELARSVIEIKETTKAYVGPLVNYEGNGHIIPIFNLLPKGIEHVYVSYPEGRIIFRDVTIGGKSPQELETQLDEKCAVGSDARFLLRSEDFAKSVPEKPETLRTARLRVRYLDLPKNPITDEVYGRIKALGAELCKAAVGPHMRLEDINQPLGDVYFIVMQQITDRYGYPSVFYLERCEDGLWFGARWASPDRRWGPEDQLGVSLRK